MKFYQYLIERNIVNLDYIDSYLKNLSKDIRDQRIKKWINSNLRKYLLNQHDDVSLLTAWLSYMGKKPSWVDKALERGDKLYKIRISHQFKQKIDHILDYFEANPDLGLKGITVSNALKQSDEWVEILNKRASKDEGKIEEIEKDGSFIWVKVLDAKALNREGKLMQHCVGDYADKVKAKRCEIYSLRDSKNNPHVTIEVIKDKINQIKGKQNAPVVKKYMPYVKRFIKRFGIKDQNDLIANELIEINGIIYSFDEIPKNTVINGDLDLNESSIEKLPDNLEIGGNLYLKHTRNLKSLPKGLKVKEDLNLYNSSIEKLPDNLEVGGDLYLKHTRNLKSLPKGLKVKGNLDLYASGIEELPDNLEVAGNLDLSYTTKLKSLPKNLKVRRNLNLHYSNIEKLPDNLEVGGNLDLSYTTELKSLPKNLKVGRDLSLLGSYIIKLLDNLNVGKNLDLRYTSKYLTSLPKGLKVGGILDIRNSNIKEIPDDAIIKGKIIK